MPRISFLLLVCAAAGLLPAVYAADELEVLQFKYEIDRELLNEPLVTLRAQYQNRLLKLKDQASKAGDLDTALAAQAAADAGDPDPDKIDAQQKAIAATQRIFLEQREARLQRERRQLEELDRAYAGKLARLETALRQVGDADQASLVGVEIKKVEKLIEEHVASARRLAEQLCHVSISSNRTLSVHDLRAKAQRLSGGYRPVFETVGENLEGAKFTRVPWNKTTEMTVTAKNDGYIYIFSLSKRPSIVEEVERTAVKGMITGPYLGKAFMDRVKLRRGDSFSCKGGECAVIAEDIELE
jgi:hypothetical protein